MIYLACPYTHKEPDVVAERMKLLTKYWLDFLRLGHDIIPLVALGHFAEEHHGSEAGPGYDRWLQLDFALIDICDEVWVLCLPGWRESNGVKEEINYATVHGKRVWLLRITADGELLKLAPGIGENGL